MLKAVGSPWEAVQVCWYVFYQAGNFGVSVWFERLVRFYFPVHEENILKWCIARDGLQLKGNCSLVCVANHKSMLTASLCIQLLNAWEAFVIARNYVPACADDIQLQLNWEAFPWNYFSGCARMLSSRPLQLPGAFTYRSVLLLKMI